MCRAICRQCPDYVGSATLINAPHPYVCTHASDHRMCHCCYQQMPYRTETNIIQKCKKGRQLEEVRAACVGIRVVWSVRVHAHLHAASLQLSFALKHLKHTQLVLTKGVIMLLHVLHQKM